MFNAARSEVVALTALPVLLLASPASAELDFDDVDIEQWLGTGENEAVVVIDWTEDRQLAFGYRWDILDSATGLDVI